MAIYVCPVTETLSICLALRHDSSRHVIIPTRASVQAFDKSLCEADICRAVWDKVAFLKCDTCHKYYRVLMLNVLPLSPVKLANRSVEKKPIFYYSSEFELHTSIFKLRGTISKTIIATCLVGRVYISWSHWGPLPNSNS